MEAGACCDDVVGDSSATQRYEIKSSVPRLSIALLANSTDLLTGFEREGNATYFWNHDAKEIL